MQRAPLESSQLAIQGLIGVQAVIEAGCASPITWLRMAESLIALASRHRTSSGFHTPDQSLAGRSQPEAAASTDHDAAAPAALRDEAHGISAASAGQEQADGRLAYAKQCLQMVLESLSRGGLAVSAEVREKLAEAEAPADAGCVHLFAYY